MAKKNINEMSFLDHLEDLRWHLIRIVIAVIVLATGAFFAKTFIFDVLLLGPKKADFITYEILCNMARNFGMSDDFCYKELPFRIQSRTMSGQFSSHIWVSIAAGFVA